MIPVAKLDGARGEAVFTERCASCHGADGQGVQIGDKKAGPLWGPNSWNDGAGASRVYTLAGIIRYTMPYLDPGGLGDEDAQHVAAFITSKPRPAYPYKDRDYSGGKIPVDAVYYQR
jgi:thiosulfate dehydrogenase